MRPPRLTILIGLACAVLLFSGCQGISPGTPPASDPPGEVFGARHLQIAPGETVKIENDVGGDVQVTAYPADEVGLDYILTGWGNTEDQATAEALSNLTVTLEHGSSGAVIWARLSNNPGPAPNAQNSVLLHVRVPQTSHVDVHALWGNVQIVGAVQSATVHTNGGDITVQGVTGPLSLTTGHGAIVADERDSNPVHLELRASGGNITVYALIATVVAQTTNGSIQFVGTLQESSENAPQFTGSGFKTSGKGNIVVALPNTLKYRFRAFGGARVLTDFALDAEPCGMFIGQVSEYDFSRRKAVGNFGRVEVSGVFTQTSQVQGTMGDKIFYFETDRTTVTIFDPPNHPPRAASPAASGTIGDCGRMTTPNLAVARTDFTAQADSGDIWIHQIDMQK